MITITTTLVVLTIGLSAALPVDPNHKPQSAPRDTKQIARRQLDISGGSVEYDNADSSIIPLNIDGDRSVAVYEIVPNYAFDPKVGQYSNLIETKVPGVEEDGPRIVYQDEDDMAVAETHVFRPLFRYRAVQDDRRRRRIDEDY